MSSEGDRAGRTYWDESWAQAQTAREITISGNLRHYVNRRFDALFRQHLAALPSGAKLVEIGCANSSWLPYFAKRYGLTVSGIDYSSLGCEQASQVLARAGVDGEVVLGDLFDPPQRLLHSFDAAVSLGLVEHFSDTTKCVEAIGRLVRRDGLVITLIPNLSGILGPVQRVLDRRVYDVHVPLTAEMLAAAHSAAGLRVEDSGYLVPVHFGICNASSRPRTMWSLGMAVVVRALVALSVATWVVDERITRLPETRLFGGYAYCVATRRLEETTAS